jgi:glucose-1-phosphate thymidylyltransferase
MKALVLSGGKGTRLQPITHTRSKQLVPIANKPILFYVIENIMRAGIVDIGIVISPETGDEIKEAVTNQGFKATFTFILQAVPGGLAHAVKVSRSFLGNDKFVMYLGDNLLEESIADVVHYFEKETTAENAYVFLKPVQNPSSFGVATVDRQGKIIKLVEKPKNPECNLALVGVYFFTSDIHEIIANLEPSARGELEITEAIQRTLDEGGKIGSHTLEGWWLDTGKKEDLLTANSIVLDSWVQRDLNDVKTEGKSEIFGRVELGKNVSIVASTLRGPCIIGDNCVINRSRINPYTSVGANSVIGMSKIDHSVIMENVSLFNIDMEDSLIRWSAVASNFSSA